jgi:hypothetical protein
MENNDLGSKNALYQRGFRSNRIPLEHIYQRSNLRCWNILCMPVLVTTAVLMVVLVVVTTAVLEWKRQRFGKPRSSSTFYPRLGPARRGI